MENNSRRDIEIRRNRGILYHIGRCVIIFGLWTVAKTAGLSLLTYSTAVGSAEEIASGSANVLSGAELATSLVMIAIGLAARLYIGRAALAVSRGEHRSSLFIVITVFMAIGSFLIISLAVAGVVYILKTAPEILQGRRGIISALIVETTSMIMLIELIAAALRLKKLEKKGSV